MGKKQIGIIWGTIAAGAVLTVAGAARAAPQRVVPPPPPMTQPATDFGAFVRNDMESPRVALSDDGQTLYVTGTLLEGSYLKVVAAARKSPRLHTVYLASFGGLTMEGRMIGLYIRKRGFDTYVEHVCASSCTMAFVAGHQRVLGAEGQIGFHQGFVVDEKGVIQMSKDEPAPYTAVRGFAPVVGVGGTPVMRMAFEAAGLTPELIAKALTTPSQTMWNPPEAELRGGNVFTRLAAAPELPPPPGFGMTRAEVDDQLAGLPMWSSLKAYSPTKYENSAREVWRGLNTGLRPSIARWRAREDVVRFAQAELRTAPDPLLDRMILLYGELARAERGKDYSGCRVETDLIPKAPSSDDAAFGAREDALIVELFRNPVRIAPLSADQAVKDFRKLAGRIARQGRFDFWSDEGSEHECRMGLQTLEAIAALDPKRRVKAYRALLSMPDEEPAAEKAGSGVAPDPNRN